MKQNRGKSSIPFDVFNELTFIHRESTIYLHFLSRNPTFRSTNNAQRGHSKRFSQKMARSVVMEAIQTLGAIQVRRGGRENVRRDVELRGTVPTRHTRSHLHLLLVLNL